MRTSEEMDTEYSKLCAQLGDVQFKMQLLSDTHQHLMRQLQALQQEATALKNQPKEEVNVEGT